MQCEILSISPASIDRMRLWK